MVATSGVVELRNKFRQFTTDPYQNLFPNVLIQTQKSVATPASLVFGNMLGLPIGQLHLSSVMALFQKGDEVELHSRIDKSPSLFWSAWMESRNVTRWIIPSNSSTPKISQMSQIYIENMYYWQQQLDIWSSYEFLDSSQVTSEQWQAIECERMHLQDCSIGSICLPNPEACPEAEFLLEDLSP